MGSENLDISQKFQLTQFYFDGQRGFLTKSTFEIIIKNLIRIFQNLWFLLPSTSVGIFSTTLDQSKLRFFEISIFVTFLMVIFSAMDFINLPILKWIELNKNFRNINSLIVMIFESGLCIKKYPIKVDQN